MVTGPRYEWARTWPHVLHGAVGGVHLGDLRVTNTTGEWPVLEAGL